MNRFFLSIGEHHGAYKDCFGLPAFISLFCSRNAEDPEQARKERMWALQMLHDGVRDEYCFRLASRRHVPDLLLTSFDTYSSRTLGENDFEQGAILETIESLLRNGGQLAISHLICSIALLSWMRGILVGRVLQSAMRTIALRSKYLQLLNTALSIVQGQKEEGSIPEFTNIEALHLAGPLMELYSDTSNNFLADWDRSRNNADVNHFLVSLFQCLCTIQSCSISVCGNEISYSLEDGICLDAALSFLSRVKKDDDMFARAVGAFCFLPVNVTTARSHTVESFCIEVLAFVLQNCCTKYCNIYADIFRRLSLLSTVLNDETKHRLMPTLISCRRKCSACSGGIQVWEECLSNFVKNKNVALSENGEMGVAEISSSLIQVNKPVENPDVILK